MSIQQSHGDRIHFVVECRSGPFRDDGWVPMSEEFDSLVAAEAWYEEARDNLTRLVRLVEVQTTRRVLRPFGV